MSANAGSGGVRNLRAMFENKASDQSNSPPSRGRSPSGSVASTNSRPVSKVRASFVAVERSGEQGQLWGLRKASDVSSMAEVIKENESGGVDGGPLTNTQSTPEKAINGGLGTILKGSSFAGTPRKEQPNKLEQIQQEGKASLKPSPAEEQNKQSKPSGAGAKAVNTANRLQDKSQSAASEPRPAHPAKTNPKPIETKASVPPKSDKQSPKTPTSAGVRPRGGVAKIKGVMDSARRASEAREAAKKTEAAPKTPTEATTKSPTKVNGAKKDAVKSPRPSNRPKSPTKPVKLPSSATAPTAASAAHIHSNQQPAAPKPTHSSKAVKLPAAAMAPTAASAAHERSGQESEAKKPASRRPSGVQSSQPRMSVSGTQASLGKKTSRASLAERPKSRTSLSKPDDGFLARMMRPTQSSAQKTHDKVQVQVHSPPRNKPAAALKAKPSRPSLNQHAHHDHVDEKGDYAPKTPVSPAEARRVEPAGGAAAEEKEEAPTDIPEPVHKEIHQPATQAELPAAKEDAPKPDIQASGVAELSSIGKDTEAPGNDQALEVVPEPPVDTKPAEGHAATAAEDASPAPAPIEADTKIETPMPLTDAEVPTEAKVEDDVLPQQAQEAGGEVAATTATTAATEADSVAV